MNFFRKEGEPEQDKVATPSPVDEQEQAQGNKAQGDSQAGAELLSSKNVTKVLKEETTGLYDPNSENLRVTIRKTGTIAYTSSSSLTNSGNFLKPTVKGLETFTKDYRLANQMKMEKCVFLLYVLAVAMATIAFFNIVKEISSIDIAETTTAQTLSGSFEDYSGISKDEAVIPASEEITYHIEIGETPYTSYEVAGHELSEPVHLEANEEYFITLLFSEDGESFKEIEVKRPTGEIERVAFAKPIRSASES